MVTLLVLLAMKKQEVLWAFCGSANSTFFCVEKNLK